MKRFLVFLLILASTSRILAEDLRIDVLDTPELVTKEYCRVAPISDTRDCGYLGRLKMLNVYLPQSISSAIISHINQAKKNAYYDEINQYDFFHGHFIVRGPRLNYTSMDDFISDVSVILYHSAEFNNRWLGEARQAIPAEKRRTRSFLGWLDGREEKAIDVVTAAGKNTKTINYETSGTIVSNELVSARPDLSNHAKIQEVFMMNSLNMNVCKGDKCYVCHPFGQFHIVKEPTGRFTLDNGDKVELYLRCILD